MVVSGAAIVALTILGLVNPPVYSTEIMGNGEKYQFDVSYTVQLADEKYGDVEIRYVGSVEDYMVHADFKRAGDTVLTLVSPTGDQEEYDIHIERHTYEITKRNAEEAGS